jgi:LSD1 subclass zinc finger protein
MEFVQFPCPSCRQLLQLPADSAGKNFRCPQCQYVGTMPASSGPVPAEPASVFGVKLDDPPAPPPGPDPRWQRLEEPGPPRGRKRTKRPFEGTIEEEVEADPESQRRLSERLAGWRKVRWGINVVYVALVIWVGTVALTLLTFCAIPILVRGGFQPSGPPGTGLASAREAGLLAVILVLLLMAVGMLVNIAQIVGYSLCLFVPSRTGALPWAIIAVALTFFSFGLGVVGLIVPGVPLLAMLIGLGGWIAFLLFLRAVGVELDVTWLVQSIQSVLAFLVFGVGGTGLVLVVLSFLAASFAESGRRSGPAVVGCGLLCDGALFVTLLFVVLFRYLHILRDTAAQIEEELALRVQPLTGKAARRIRDY